ncbi:MAG: hypothetical protein KGL77_03170 [Actinomycetales bacterium]|nr:hypothetical protein [Actinomycetales bacterium]
MKRNNSLATFTNAINGLLIGGGALFLIGLIATFANRMDFGATLVGGVLIYISSGLIGLAIFGAFLRITAKAIIEGLGGNLAVSDLQAYVAPAPAPQAAASNEQHVHAPKRAVNTGPSDGWQQLTGKEYKAWQAAGEPNLRPWDEAGRPDFMTWLSQNA